MPPPPSADRAIAGRPLAVPPNRLALVAAIGGLALGFGVLTNALVTLAEMPIAPRIDIKTLAFDARSPRPVIVDRAGRVLVGNIRVHALYANPQRVVDVEHTIDQLRAILPALDAAVLRERLSDRTRQAVRLDRDLTPSVARAIFDLGLPGIDLHDDWVRAYPNGRLAAHLLGGVYGDGSGISGIERYLDTSDSRPLLGPAGADAQPRLQLTLDLGAQHVLTHELASAMANHEAHAAAGVVMDIHSGAVIAAVSLPDFDPQWPGSGDEPGRLDRLSFDRFELGSVFKVLTVAMALDSGKVRLSDAFDTATPIEIGRHTLKADTPQPARMDVTEIFLRSSNLGTVRLAQAAGAREHEAFLRALGLAEPMDLAIARIPRRPEWQPWGPATATTAAYGYGVSITPLQFTTAFSAIVNGGRRVTPRFVAGAASPEGGRVLRRETSAQIVSLLRANVEAGTGRAARVEGLAIGGKTGTARKLGPGGYEKGKLITSFAAVYPTDAPRYALFVLLDEPRPQGTDLEGHASRNAAPAAGAILARMAPILNTLPVDAPRADERPFDASLRPTY